MDSTTIMSRFGRLGARMAMFEATQAVEPNEDKLVVARTDCVANPNLCEKPVSSDSMKVPIILGVW